MAPAPAYKPAASNGATQRSAILLTRYCDEDEIEMTSSSSLNSRSS
jgi:hypothetical protein